jgi:hypothetical protein
MQSAYQSDEFDDDASSYDDPTSSDGAYAYREAGSEEDNEEHSEESSGEQEIHARVDRQAESESGESWLDQLGPRTRRKARVNYNEAFLATTPPQVCLDGFNLWAELLESQSKSPHVSRTRGVSGYVLALTCRKDTPARQIKEDFNFQPLRD